MKKLRLDTLLVELGYFPDKDAALRAVLAHEVKVNDEYVTSAAIKVASTAALSVKDQKQFVSRGGHKLQAALVAFEQKVSGMNCLDVGASTGGFTDCLLQAGAAHVTCVDVNYGQLAWRLRTDARVTVYERLNIRHVCAKDIAAPYDMIVADLSFIGLAQLAPVFANLARRGTVFIGLVKPQFEARADEVNGGVVYDTSIRERVVQEVKEAFVQAEFVPSGVIESPIKGPAGNVEFLVRATFKV